LHRAGPAPQRSATSFFKPRPRSSPACSATTTRAWPPSPPKPPDPGAATLQRPHAVTDHGPPPDEYEPAGYETSPVSSPESARTRGKTIGGAAVTDPAMASMAAHLRDQGVSLRDIAAHQLTLAHRSTEEDERSCTGVRTAACPYSCARDPITPVRPCTGLRKLTTTLAVPDSSDCPVTDKSARYPRRDLGGPG
jgi:hypothetical protein